MLSGHYELPHAQHTQQGPYATQQQAISSLLPTPPSSPPTIGMHPVESTISLLESLVAFYHQERMWVYRTRAQLEMGLLHPIPDTAAPELHDDPDAAGQSSPESVKSAENTSPSPPTKWLKRKKAFNLRLEGISSARNTRRGICKHPHAQHRARQSSNLNPASSHLHASTSASLQPVSNNVSFYPPTAVNPTTLTSPYLSHPSFQFSTQQPLTPGVRHLPTPAHHAQPTVQPSQPHTGPLVLGAGGHEPTVQILEMFERMMQARMESCERVTRMVRVANNPGGAGAGATGGSVGGPVGGFGGPVGLPVGVGPQEIVGSYSVQTPVQGFLE